MTIRRAMPVLTTDDPQAARAFYESFWEGPLVESRIEQLDQQLGLALPPA